MPQTRKASRHNQLGDKLAAIVGLDLKHATLVSDKTHRAWLARRQRQRLVVAVNMERLHNIADRANPNGLPDTHPHTGADGRHPP